MRSICTLHVNQRKKRRYTLYLLPPPSHPSLITCCLVVRFPHSPHYSTRASIDLLHQLDFFCRAGMVCQLAAGSANRKHLTRSPCGEGLRSLSNFAQADPDLGAQRHGHERGDAGAAPRNPCVHTRSFGARRNPADCPVSRSLPPAHGVVLLTPGFK